MASSGRSPPKGKKGGEEKNWKSGLARLVSSCSSGRSKEAKKKSAGLNAAAPSTPPGEAGWTRLDDDANVSKEVVTVNAIHGHGTDEEVELSYTDLKEIGQGTFGIVYRAKLCETGELVAIKKTLDDPKFKNRELVMMRQLEHPNVLDLRYFFYTTGAGYKQHERYLNMVMDYIPGTLFSVAKCDGTYTKPLLEPLYVKLYTYQLFRSLAYLHSLNVSHRDVKPQNLLLDPETHVIKLCDFGSAKELSKGDTNVAYICSRYYRAPELVLGATDYTCQIDVWSAGCVLAELFQSHPIFPGANGPDQMVEIIKILGTPSMDDLADINPRFMEFRFPYLAPVPWEKVFKQMPPVEALDLIYKTLLYSPSHRISPLEACAHSFYDELRRKGTRLKNGRRLPPLFNFKHEELEINPALNSRLRPDFDEDDEAYLQSLSMSSPHGESSPTGDGQPISRLDSFRSSLKKKIPKISQIKRIGSKKGSEKIETTVQIERTDLDDAPDAEAEDSHMMEDEERYRDQESADYGDGVEEGHTVELDSSVPHEEVHAEKRKGKKGKRSKRKDNLVVDNSDIVDSFMDSMNQSGFEPTENVTAEMESLEIQAPRQKKGKKKKKVRKESSEEGDTTLDDAQHEHPFASTPTGKVEKLSTDPFPSPPHNPKEEHVLSTSADIHSENLDDSGAVRKTKKKTTKKKSRNENGVSVETTEVTETIVTTSKSSKVSDF